METLTINSVSIFLHTVALFWSRGSLIDWWLSEFSNDKPCCKDDKMLWIAMTRKPSPIRKLTLNIAEEILFFVWSCSCLSTIYWCLMLSREWRYSWRFSGNIYTCSSLSAIYWCLMLSREWRYSWRFCGIIYTMHDPNIVQLISALLLSNVRMRHGYFINT